MSQTTDLLSKKLTWYFHNDKLFPEITEDHWETQQHFIKEAKKLEEKIVKLEKVLSDLSWGPLPEAPPTGH